MAFDPISAAITGGLAFLDMQSKREASKAAQAQLAETRRMNAEMLRMAQAGQTDAFGNRFSYDQALNEWLTKLTPEQQSLISSGEREQRLGLTEDASRNREIRRMQAGTGRQAGDLLSQALTRYASGGPSEEGTRSELTRLLSQATPTGGLRRDVSPGGAIISGGQRGGTPMQRMAKILLQSRQGALGETGQRESQRQQRDLGGAGTLSSLMGGGQTGINFGNTGESIDAKRNALSNRLLQTQQGAIGNLQGPYGNVSKTADTMPGLKEIASLYAALNRGTTKAGSNTTRNVPSLFEPSGKSSLGPSPSSLSVTEPFSSWVDSTKYPWNSSQQSWF
jgi:hypothetical protein